MFLIGAILIFISLYPIYKTLNIPDKSELEYNSGRIKTINSKRDRKGSERIEIFLFNNSTKYVLDDVIIKRLKFNIFDEFEKSPFLTIGVDTSNSFTKNYSLTSDNIYSLIIGDLEVLSYKEIVDIRSQNNYNYFLFFLVCGILTIGLSILYIHKTKKIISLK